MATVNPKRRNKLSDFLIDLLNLRTTDINSFRTHFENDNFFTETLNLNLNFERRKSLMPTQDRRLTLDQINDQLEKIFEKTCISEDPFAHKNALFAEQLPPLFLELLVHAKVENFKLGTNLENCLLTTFFVLKKSLREFMVKRSKTDKKQADNTAEMLEKLKTERDETHNKNVVLTKKLQEAENEAKFLRLQNDKLHTQVSRYNAFHYKTIQAIKSLNMIVSKLTMIHEKVSSLLEILPSGNKAKWNQDHVLMEMYSVHSSSARIIAVIESFKVEFDLEEIEV